MPGITIKFCSLNDFAQSGAVRTAADGIFVDKKTGRIYIPRLDHCIVIQTQG